MGYQVKNRILQIKYNGPFPLPRDQWEVEIQAVSPIFLSLEEAEEYRDVWHPDGFIEKVSEEPSTQNQKCDGCGERLPHYVEVIADDNCVYYICPRCNYHAG